MQSDRQALFKFFSGHGVQRDFPLQHSLSFATLGRFLHFMPLCGGGAEVAWGVLFGLIWLWVGSVFVKWLFLNIYKSVVTLSDLFSSLLLCRVMLSWWFLSWWKLDERECTYLCQDRMFCNAHLAIFAFWKRLFRRIDLFAFSASCWKLRLSFPFEGRCVFVSVCVCVQGIFVCP